MAIINGDNQNNILTGTSSNDQIYGFGGDDELIGGDGNDYLDGGEGNDVFIGGAGQDTFVIDVESTTATNEIKDFQLGVDQIDLTKVGIADLATVQILLDSFNAGASNSVFGFYRNDGARVTIIDAVSKYDFSAANFIFSTAVSNDNLTGSNGQDDLFGGLGNDTVAGGLGNDRLFGEQGNDILYGNDGNDQLYGGAGNDQLFGGTGNDYLYGGDGNDLIDGGPGSDVMTGGAGNDTFVVSAEPGPPNSSVTQDTITDFNVTQDKLDVSSLGISDFGAIEAISSVINFSNYLALVYTINGNQSHLLLNTILPGDLNASDFLFSTVTANEKIIGTVPGSDLFGGLGNDTLIGTTNGGGNIAPDRLFGGGGNDVLYGYNPISATSNVNNSNDLLYGGDGNDQLFGGGGNDLLSGGNGNDTLTGGGGADTLDGGGGINTASYLDSPAAVAIVLWNGSATGGNATGDFLINIQNLIGSAGDDTLLGDAQNNVIDGAGGNDHLNGEGGINTVSYASANAGVTVNLGLGGGQNTGGAGTDTLLNFANLSGSNFNDHLAGNSGNNVLTGGAGSDVLTGGAGNDSFVFTSKIGTDTVTDFSHGADKLLFSQAGLAIGNGNTVVNGGVVIPSGSGGFANSAELVIMQQNIAGNINTTSAANLIGSASAAYTLGQTALFAVDNGTATGVFLFTSANTDAKVTAGELVQIALIGNTASTALADYGFVG